MPEQTDAEAWPYFVIVHKRCDQVGIMRFRLLRDAKNAADVLSQNMIGVCCYVHGLDGQEVYSVSAEKNT